MLNLRSADEDDQSFLYEVLETTMQEYYIEAFGSFDEEVEKEFFDESFKNSEYLIVEFEDEDIGCVAIQKNKSHIFINEFMILPDYQNKGLGKMIFDNVNLQVNKDNLPIHIEVLKVNEIAMKFWIKMGFVLESESKSHYLMNKNIFN